MRSPENKDNGFRYLLIWDFFNSIEFERRKNPEYFPIFGYLLELIIRIWQFGEKNPSKSGEFGPFFSL